MKSDKLITILGNNNYLKCNYNEFDNCVYIQEALVRKYKDEISEVVVFATKDSLDSNWGEGKDGDGNYDPGLEKILENLQEKENFDFEFKSVQIPTGYSQEEIWEIFNLFVEEIEKEDNIYFDITHGFRYQPMLVMSILNYAKVLKNIKIKSIDYGLFEEIGPFPEVKKMPVEERNAEILDLTAFDYLNDWVVAVDSFITTGRTDKINNLSMQQIGKKLSLGRELDKSKYNFFKELSTLIGKLQQFNVELKTSRGNVLNETIIEILETLNNLEKIKAKANDKIAPFLKVVDKIKDKFIEFDEKDEKGINNYFKLLQWCDNHELIQQGLVILIENFISLVADDLGYPYCPSQEFNNDAFTLRGLRHDIEKCLVELSAPDFKLKKSDYRTNPEVFNKIKSKLKNDYHDFVSIYGEIKDKRNDVSHFGMSDNSTINAKQLKKDFEDYVEQLEELIEQLDI